MELTKGHFDARVDALLVGIRDLATKLDNGVKTTPPGTIQLPPEGVAMQWIEAFNLTKGNPNVVFETDTAAGVFIFKGQTNLAGMGMSVWEIGRRPIAGI